MSSSSSFLSLFFCTLLMGCAAPVAQLPSAGQADLPVSTDLCEFQSSHVRADGVVMPEGYYCIVFQPLVANNAPQTPQSGFSSAPHSVAPAGTGYIPSGCGYIASYTRGDGKIVGPFVRCTTTVATSSYRTLNSTGQPAPCVSSNCGPVNVKGYYRKDGTYVRPHTRKR
jgi:hypothetical protein